MVRNPPIIAERYHVHKLIARGGMASVFLAEHVALHRNVALKILHPPIGLENSEDAQFEQRFKLEAETLAALNHPNIVTLFDYGQTDDGRFFLAMEYIDGPRFTDVIAEGTLPPDRAIELLLQVCAALRYAHKRGVVHRDLKPSNLLISRDAEGVERLKVVDFGLVKVGEVDQSLTREGIVLGSPHCMAPEQVQGFAIDHRADIYALGVLLTRSLTGVYPFHGNTATATMMAHLSEPIPTFAALAPNHRVPARIEQIVRRCLAKKPEDRYPDIATLAVDLQQAIGLVPEPDHSQSLTMIEEALPPAPPVRRAIPWPAIGAVAQLTVVSIGWLIWRTAPDPALVAAAAQAEIPIAPTEATLELAPSEAVVAPPEVDPPVEAVPVTTKPPPFRSKPTASKPATKPQGSVGAAPPADGQATLPAENPEGYMPLPDDLK